MGKNYFPSLEIVATVPGESHQSISLIGFLEWDGCTYPNKHFIFGNEDPSTVLLEQRNWYKEEPLFYDMMMLEHGIEYALFEITQEKNAQPIVKRLILEEDNTISLELIKDDNDIVKSLPDFFMHNNAYIQEVCQIVSSMYHFI